MAGIDEAGVAPLAGPVVAAAVILKPGTTLRLLPKVRDSKLMSPLERQRLYDIIIGRAEDFAVGVAEVHEIESINIRQATLLAMRRAFKQLKKADMVMVDGPWTIPGISNLQFAVVDGDAKIASISAASIIAKVTRDLMMNDLHHKFPQYGFDRHKGYPTKLHALRLKEYGPSPVHRQSFLKNFI